MKRFFLFMVMFIIAFTVAQNAESFDIPCIEKQGAFYKTTLREYTPSDSEKREQNLSGSQGIFLWEMTDWSKSDTTAQCGMWNEATKNFTFPCKGLFEFHRDMGGPDIFGFYWKQTQNQTPSVGVPTLSSAMVDVNKDVVISFVPNNINTASYTTSDGQTGTFSRDASGNFTTALNFSSVGVKTVSISGVDTCGTSVSQSTSVTVTNICAKNSPPSLTGDTVMIENVPVFLSSVIPFPQNVSVVAPQSILVSLSIDDPDGLGDIDLAKTGLEDKVNSGASSTYKLNPDAEIKNNIKGLIQGVGSHELRVVVTDKCGKTYDKTFSFSISAMQYETSSTPLTPKGDLPTPSPEPPLPEVLKTDIQAPSPALKDQLFNTMKQDIQPPSVDFILNNTGGTVTNDATLTYVEAPPKPSL